MRPYVDVVLLADPVFTLPSMGSEQWRPMTTYAFKIAGQSPSTCPQGMGEGYRTKKEVGRRSTIAWAERALPTLHRYRHGCL